MKYRNVSISYGSIPEGFWQAFQSINSDGKILGTGSFKIDTQEESRLRQWRRYKLILLLSGTEDDSYWMIRQNVTRKGKDTWNWTYQFYKNSKRRTRLCEEI